MTAQQFQQMLLDSGVDQATVNVLSSNAQLQARTLQLAQQQEFDRLASEKQAIEANYNKTRPIAEWYDRNHAALEQLKQERALYEERFGPLNAQQQQQTQVAPGGKQFTDADIQKAVDDRMTSQYGPQITDSLMATGEIMERHIGSGRKNKIDWPEIKKRAIANGGNLLSAYNEWDAPEAKKAADADKETEIQSRIKAEREKWMMANSGDGFPAGAGFDYASSGNNSPSPLTPRHEADGSVKPYDRNVLLSAVREVRSDPNFTPGFGKRPN